VDGHRKVTRYNLAYINPFWYAGDNGCVLGYDNAHGKHHRHFMETVTPVSLRSFAEIENRFQLEWQVLIKEKKHAKDRNSG
jgi:Family of unknown function (DUF6516)